MNRCNKSTHLRGRIGSIGCVSEISSAHGQHKNCVTGYRVFTRRPRFPSSTWSSGKATMAHAGGAAGGGGAGGGGGEHDVPDLRFLVSPTSVGKWYFEEERTVGELEALLIQYLRSVNVSEEELDDEFPVTEQLNRQRPVVVTLNARAGRLKIAVRRREDFAFSLW